MLNPLTTFSAPDQEIDPKQRRANYFYHVIDGGFYMGGASFVAPNCILPRIIELLGGPSWIISLAPALNMLGFNALPMVTAHRVETMKRVMPLMRVAGAFQRVPFLLAGLLLLFTARSCPWLPLIAVLSAPLLSGIVGGLTATAWQELVAKTVLNQKRSSLFAWRFAVSSVIGIFAGGIIAAILASVPGVPGYGVMYLIGFGFLTVSYVFFVRIREPVHEQRELIEGVTFIENMRRMLDILRQDGRLRRYIAVTFLTNATLIMVPFLPLFILRTTGRDDGFLGILVMAQMTGSIAGNLLAGISGDRWGSKLIMMTGRIIMAASCAIAGFLHADWAFVGLFVVQGAAGASIMVGAQTMNIEICPYDRRSTYLALMSIVNVPALLLFPLMGSQLWDMKLGFSVLTILSALFLVISIIVLNGIPEPRRKAQAACE